MTNPGIKEFIRLLLPITLLMAVFVFVFSGTALSAAHDEAGIEDLADRFSAHDPDSQLTLSHEVFTEFLQATVFDVGRSKSRLGQEKPATYKQSHITYASGKPSRYEGNRVYVHDFTPAHMEYLLIYKEGLEEFAAQRSLASLNSDEQLAFWLNLYNVTVLVMLAEEYPIKTLKSQRMGSGKTQSFWQKKSVQVEGVPLSLLDIEQIVYRKWRDPLVVYGFFQGTIGGPCLRTEAYSGASVWADLKKNAIEFVNSNRGVRPRGSKAEVSLFYAWGAAAFGNSDEALIGHIQEYADENFHSDLSTLATVKKKYYDWNVADMLGGVRHTGGHNQVGGLLTAGSRRDVQADEMTDVTGLSNYVRGFAKEGSANQPPQLLELLAKIYKHNDVPTGVPVVTVEECPKDDDCRP